MERGMPTDRRIRSAHAQKHIFFVLTVGVRDLDTFKNSLLFRNCDCFKKNQLDLQNKVIYFLEQF